MIPLHISNLVVSSLEKKFKKHVTLINASVVLGGCINNAYKLNTSIGLFFLKFNSYNNLDFFSSEANGLLLLKNKSEIYIPNVIAVHEKFLILEYLAGKIEKPDFWEGFGRQLAFLHKNTDSHFGLDQDNFIGTIKQVNYKTNSWIDFFINYRLRYVLKLGSFPSTFEKKFELIFKRFSDIFKNNRPVLLHGDLWNGNYICLGSGVALIDPAVYYGCKEMDLGMSRLFGGFNQQFYDGYHSVSPLEKGWEERCDFCNLYPLLVHCHLFGNNYFKQTLSVVNQYI